MVHHRTHSIDTTCRISHPRVRSDAVLVERDHLGSHVMGGSPNDVKRFLLGVVLFARSFVSLFIRHTGHRVAPTALKLATRIGTSATREACSVTDQQAVAWLVAVLRHAASRLDRKDNALAKFELLILDLPVPTGDTVKGRELWARRLYDQVPSAEEIAASRIDLSRLYRSLPRRDADIARLLARGLRPREVAAVLGITVRTVRRHRATIAQTMVSQGWRCF